MKRISRQKSVMTIEANPIEAATANIATVKVENLSDCELITAEQFQEIMKIIGPVEENVERLKLLEQAKLPYLFGSEHLIKMLELTESVKTRLAMIEMIGSRLVDPKAQTVYFTGLFRFTEEKRQVEEILKARHNTMSSALFTKNDGMKALALGGRGGRGPGGAGRGLASGRGRGGSKPPTPTNHINSTDMTGTNTAAVSSLTSTNQLEGSSNTSTTTNTAIYNKDNNRSVPVPPPITIFNNNTSSTPDVTRDDIHSNLVSPGSDRCSIGPRTPIATNLDDVFDQIDMLSNNYNHHPSTAAKTPRLAPIIEVPNELTPIQGNTDTDHTNTNHVNSSSPQTDNDSSTTANSSDNSTTETPSKVELKRRLLPETPSTTTATTTTDNNNLRMNHTRSGSFNESLRKEYLDAAAGNKGSANNTPNKAITTTTPTEVEGVYATGFGKFIELERRSSKRLSATSTDSNDGTNTTLPRSNSRPTSFRATNNNNTTSSPAIAQNRKSGRFDLATQFAVPTERMGNSNMMTMNLLAKRRPSKVEEVQQTPQKALLNNTAFLAFNKPSSNNTTTNEVTAPSTQQKQPRRMSLQSTYRNAMTPTAAMTRSTSDNASSNNDSNTTTTNNTTGSNVEQSTEDKELIKTRTQRRHSSFNSSEAMVLQKSLTTTPIVLVPKEAAFTDLANRCAFQLHLSKDDFLSLEEEGSIHTTIDGQQYYSYRELVRRNFMKSYGDLKNTELEKYLGDDEFMKVFQKAKTAFYEQARWKQVEQKKKALLF